MDDSDFQKNKPQRCKIGIKNEKNEMKMFYFGDHIRTWTVIFKKRSSQGPAKVNKVKSINLNLIQ